MGDLPVDPNLWVIPPLVSFMTLLALAGLALINGKVQKLSLLFSGICLLGALLSLEKALASVVTDPDLVLKSSRLDHMFVVFFLPLYLHFTHTFLGLVGRRSLIGFAYAFSGCLSAFSQSAYYIVGVNHYAFGFYPRGGFLIFVFGAASTANTLYCLYLLFCGLRRERDPDRKNKTKYIILGLGGAALMAHLNFFPLMGIGVYPLGNLAFIPLLVLGFAVLKHDLLDIGLALQKGLIYSLLTGLLTGAYALAIILFEHVFKGMGQRWSVLFSIFFFVIIVFVFEPMKTRIQGIIDGLLFRGKYDYQKTLGALSDAMAAMLNLDEILDSALGTLTDTMYLNWTYVMLKDDGGAQLKIRSHKGNAPLFHGMAIGASGPLIFELGVRKKEGTRRNISEWALESKDPAGLRQDFDRLGGTVVLPMIFKGEVDGLLVLGNKKSGDVFTSQDLQLLRTLASQCAISVENAKAYQLIENLNVNLESMVEKRTRELKKALDEKERAQDLLIRSESLAAVGALVAGVAHELNNPLASVYSLVQSSLETMEDEGFWRGCVPAGGEPKKELVDDLKFSLKELRRAKDIVASLLGISRQTQEYSEPVQLNDVARDALKVLYNQYKNTGIEVTEHYEPDLPEVKGNFANLGQVFLNIITNAVQAVDKVSGKISIKTRFDQPQGIVVFECEDNGPGISKGMAQNIFKPFFTTKEVGKGTGLGLYISHEIIRRHNGHILAKNSRQGGATFEVALPLSGLVC